MKSVEGETLRHVHRAAARFRAQARQGGGRYIDDIREPEGTLHVAIGQSPKARGRLLSLDLSAVRARPGVVAVLTAADIPGKNDVSPAFGDDPLFVDGEIAFHGQALFAVVRDHDDRAPRRGLPSWRSSRAPERHGRGRAGARRDRAARLRLRPRRCGAAIARRPMRLEG